MDLWKNVSTSRVFPIPIPVSENGDWKWKVADALLFHSVLFKSFHFIKFWLYPIFYRNCYFYALLSDWYQPLRKSNYWNWYRDGKNGIRTFLSTSEMKINWFVKYLIKKHIVTFWYSRNDSKAKPAGRRNKTRGANDVRKTGEKEKTQNQRDTRDKNLAQDWGTHANKLEKKEGKKLKHTGEGS